MVAHAELTVVRAILEQIITCTQSTFRNRSVEEAAHIEPIEEVEDDMVEKLRTHHLRRLRSGVCNIDAGCVFLDILVNVERISDQCSNVGVHTVSFIDIGTSEMEHAYVSKLHHGASEAFNREYEDLRTRYFERLSALEADPDLQIAMKI